VLLQYPGPARGGNLYFGRRGLSYHAVYAVDNLSHGGYFFLDHIMVRLICCEVKDAGEELWSSHGSVPCRDDHRIHVIQQLRAMSEVRLGKPVGRPGSVGWEGAVAGGMGLDGVVTAVLGCHG
jgi:D-serine deaminase-like pyridoxal phosphate-dependent protein